jgi:hypothetical protein
MRITFFTEDAAQAAVDIWKRHGFEATRTGTVVATDCPTLWAVPVINRAIGFDKVKRFDVVATDDAPLPRQPFGPEDSRRDPRRAAS